MLTFIKVHGVYMAFWIIMGVLGLVGVYWAVYLAITDALRNQ